MSTTTHTRGHRGYDIPNSPEDQEHAAEAARIEQDLLRHGIVSERVAPTRDRKGHVRLTFADVDKLLDLIYKDPS